MKRMLGIVLALAVMAGMPTFAQEKGKDEGKKGTSAVEKKAGQEGDAKKADTAKKEEPKKDVKKAAAKKGAKKGHKKEDKKDEKKST